MHHKHLYKQLYAHIKFLWPQTASFVKEAQINPEGWTNFAMKDWTEYQDNNKASGEGVVDMKVHTSPWPEKLSLKKEVPTPRIQGF